MSGISGRELKKRLDRAHLNPMAAHTLNYGLVLYPGQAAPSCSICGGPDAPIVNGRHLTGFCGCSGVWTDDDYEWRHRPGSEAAS